MEGTPEIDPTIANVARMYDYTLGGTENFAADREAVHRLIELAPVFVHSAREIRAFLGRAVRELAQAGIRQFLDIGSGLPTQQNVHQIVHQVAPGARVIYCDHDPVVVAHTTALLAGQDNAWMIQRDLRRPEEILDDPVVRAVMDFGEPVAVLLVAVLHFIADPDDPAGIVRYLADAIPPGSYMAIAHATEEWHPERREEYAQTRRLYDQRVSSSFSTRRSQDVTRWLEGTGMEVLDPGAVPVSAWRPARPGDADGAERTGVFGVAAVKPPRAAAPAGA